LDSRNTACDLLRHPAGYSAACFRDEQALALAIEQFHGELGFERFDLVAHRTLRDAKLFCGA
jgi:hypothetical protein